MKKEILKKLKEISKKLKENYYAAQVIVYGSYANGTETDESDIDLLVIVPTNEKYLDRMATVRRLIREEKRGIPVSPLVITPEELKIRIEKGDQFIQEILSRGIEL